MSDRVGAGLPQRPDGTGPRHHQLLPDDPDLGFVRARDRRSAAGRLRGDGPARDRQAALQGCIPRTACRRHRHRARARDPCRGFRASGRRLSRSSGKAFRTGDRRRCRQEIVGEGDRRGAGADPSPERRQARARYAQIREEAADHSRQGRRLRTSRRRNPRIRGEERRAVPADEHGQGPAPRHPSTVRGRGALDGIEGLRRRDVDRRTAQLVAVARQGQELGRCAEEVHPDRHRTEGNRFQCRDRSTRGRRHRQLRLRDACRDGWQLAGRARLDKRDCQQARSRTSPKWRRA